MHISPSLSLTELANLESSLASHFASNGPVILGSQLGTFLTQAVKPRTLQELGGLKRIVANDLQELVQIRPRSPDAPDAEFEILSTPGSRPLPQELETEAGRTHEVAGQALWRIYSNPRLAYMLLVDDQARIYASKASDIPQGYQRLAKPDVLQFRMLAEQFADRQTDLAVKGFLKEALAPKEFYDGWIKELRRLRTPTLNLLREWEAAKSEHVAKQLQEQLLANGVDPVQAEEIIRVARPVVHTRLAGMHEQWTVSPSSRLPLPKHSTTPSADAEFRQLVHRAVDLMSIAELRELKIAAGLIYDATRSLK